MKNKLWFKSLHNWVGLCAALFVAVLSVTGLMLNHPNWMQNDDIQTVTAHPRDPQKFWMARKNGLYFSTDGAKNWTEAETPFALQEISSIAFDPSDPEQIYVLEKWGRLLVSKNGGTVWHLCALPFDSVSVAVELKQIVPGPLGHVTLLTSNGILSSTDGGKTWDRSQFNAQKHSLAVTIKMLHSGYFFGPKFFYFYDAAAVGLIVLILSGIYLWRLGKINK